MGYSFGLSDGGVFLLFFGGECVLCTVLLLQDYFVHTLSNTLYL